MLLYVKGYAMEYYWKLMKTMNQVTVYIARWYKGCNYSKRKVEAENSAEKKQPNYNKVKLQRLLDHFGKGESTILNAEKQRKEGAILVALVVIPCIDVLQKDQNLHFRFADDNKAKGAGAGKMQHQSLNKVSTALLKGNPHVDLMDIE
jgi:hypothetical protein